MNLIFYVLSSILIGILIGFFLPRTAMVIGAMLIGLGLLAMGSCVYQEFIITKPHDTSAYGMAATISFRCVEDP